MNLGNGQSVRAERMEYDQLTLEREEHPERDGILLLLRLLDLAEEAVVVVRAEGVPLVRHDVGEGVRDVARLDDGAGLAGLPEQEEVRENDTAARGDGCVNSQVSGKPT
jgi:hypothetical protein